MCVLVAQSVESICVNGAKIRDDPIEFGSHNIRLESQQLTKACCNALTIAHAIDDGDGPSITTITHRVFNSALLLFFFNVFFIAH